MEEARKIPASESDASSVLKGVDRREDRCHSDVEMRLWSDADHAVLLDSRQLIAASVFRGESLAARGGEWLAYKAPVLWR